MRNRPTFATSFAAFSEARPDLTQLAGKLLMKMDNSSYVSTPSRPYARSDLWAGGLSPAYPIPVPDRVTPTYEGRRREPERPRPALPAAREPARGARATPPPPARRPAQRHAAPLPRLPYAQGGIPAAPGGPDRPALTSPPHLSHFA